jgi:hypothetical protein
LKNGKTNTEFTGGCGGGSGWNIEGHALFIALQDAVTKDRHKHASVYHDNDSVRSNTLTFNRELLQLYQRRREQESQDAQGIPKANKPTPKHAMSLNNTFDDFSDSEDEQEYSEVTIETAEV